MVLPSWSIYATYMCSSRVAETEEGGSAARIGEQRLAELERQRRRVEAEIAALLTEADAGHWYAEDGHFTVKAWAMATTNWAPAEAATRVRMAKALHALPTLNEALVAGELGTCQVRAFARVHANPRISAQLPDSEALLVEDATNLPFEAFHAHLRCWQELADADGAHKAHDDAHRMRSARIVDVGDETLLTANTSTAHGAVLREVFEAFCDAEFTADCEAAGPDTPLPRTDSQRHADALLAIFRAAAEGGQGGQLNLVVNIVIDQYSYEAQLACSAGTPVARRDPATYRTYRCETADGSRLLPADAVAASLIGTVRQRRHRLLVGRHRSGPQAPLHRGRPRRPHPARPLLRLARLHRAGPPFTGRPSPRTCQGWGHQP